jgi:hypothetical protein
MAVERHGGRHAQHHRRTMTLAEQRRQCRDRRDGQPDLQRTQAEDGAAQRPQPLRVELQPDQEQQQHHAQLGHLGDRGRIGDQTNPPGADGRPGHQVAQHRAQPEALEHRHRDHRREQEYQCELEAFAVHAG